MTMLSPAGIPAGSFSTSASRSAAEALCRPSSTGLENGLSTRIVPEPGLLCLKWKIQLEENTTSHSPEHVGWWFRRERFIKLRPGMESEDRSSASVHCRKTLRASLADNPPSCFAGSVSSAVYSRIAFQPTRFSLDQEALRIIALESIPMKLVWWTEEHAQRLAPYCAPSKTFVESARYSQAATGTFMGMFRMACSSRVADLRQC
jgi:hypothetical protein